MAIVINELNKRIETSVERLIKGTEDGMHDWFQLGQGQMTFVLRLKDKFVCVSRDGEETVLIVVKDSDDVIVLIKNELEAIDMIDPTKWTFPSKVELVYIVPIVTVNCGSGAMIDEEKTSLVDKLVFAASRNVYENEERRKRQSAFEHDQKINSYFDEFDKLI